MKRITASTLQVLGLMTALTFLPSIVIMMTSFTRISRAVDIAAAIGLQQSPSNQIWLMALFMSFYHVASVRSLTAMRAATLHE